MASLKIWISINRVTHSGYCSDPYDIQEDLDNETRFISIPDHLTMDMFDDDGDLKDPSSLKLDTSTPCYCRTGTTCQVVRASLCDGRLFQRRNILNQRSSVRIPYTIVNLDTT